jgi:hypothetical protein
MCHTAGQRQSRQPVLFGIAVDEACKSWFLVAAVKPWRRRGLLLYPLDCSGSFIRGHGAAGRSWTNRHLPIGISQKFNALESYEKYSCGQVPANRVAFCSSLLQKRRNLRLSVCRVKCAQFGWKEQGMKSKNASTYYSLATLRVHLKRSLPRS